MSNTDYRALMRDALEQINSLQNQLKEARNARPEPLAIVGMSCRFPGHCNSIDEYWALLKEGRSGIVELTDQRGDPKSYFDYDPVASGDVTTLRMGIVDQIDRFDAEFFGITPIEAERIDPQHRVFLETAWHALEHAGYPEHKLKDSNTGVYLGISSNDYLQIHARTASVEQLSLYDGTGNVGAVAPGRLSYLLGLTGPSLAVDTACSSSIVALHMACQSLRAHETDMIVAGGVGLILSPASSVVFSRANMLSPDGLCYTFDDRANGYVRGEGCGVVVVKRLSDALRDKDNILAVIRGTAANQDGRSLGLTVPSETAQTNVIKQALTLGGVDPRSIQYVEAHGTGTALGDPIEINALTTVFGQSHNRERPLLIGSAKTNIGHMEPASGMGGLIKMVLAMQHRHIPRHLNYRNPNPRIIWQAIPIEVYKDGGEWPARNDGDDHLYAGVSSFGFSGTNTHVILQSAPQSGEQGMDAQGPHLVLLSAKNKNALDELARRYRDFAPQCQESQLANLAISSQVSRTHFRHRLALLVSSLDELVSGLDQFLAGESGTFWQYREGSKHQKRVVYLLPAQHDADPARLRELMTQQPAFAAAYQKACEALQAATGNDVAIDNAAPELVLFATQYALLQLWRFWGFQPSCLVGHGLSEITAAVCAGVFSLEDGSALYHAALQCGDDRGAIGAVLDRITLKTPGPRLLSGNTGEFVREEVTSADYWLKLDLKADIHASIGAALLEDKKLGALIELGSDNRWIQSIRSNFSADRNDVVWVPSLLPGTTAHTTLLGALQQLHLAQYNPKWEQRTQHLPYRKMALPLYPFQRKVHWLKHLSWENMAAQAQQNVVKVPVPVKSDWFYQTQWIDKPRAADQVLPSLAEEHWLVVDDGGDTTAELLQRFHQQNTLITHIRLGREWRGNIDNIWHVNAGEKKHFEDVFHTLKIHPNAFDGILFVASAESGNAEALSVDELMAAQQTLCAGLLHLVQTVVAGGSHKTPSMWIVAGGSGNEQKYSHLMHAPMLGLAKVVIVEHPELQCRRIEHFLTDNLQPLWEEIHHRATEDQVRLYPDKRQVARLRAVEADPATARPKPSIHANRSYLITGGLGGLGLCFADSLVEQGARHLVLVGRSGASKPEQQQHIARLTAQGVQVRVEALDIADPQALQALVDSLQGGAAPLAGVIHAAGVLDDGIIAQQNWSRFNTVFQPKLAGAWNLHQCTRALPLDFFVLFSSVASFFGLPGQSNYAAANSFLDALAQYRRAQNLPVLTINWGPWSEVGMGASDAVQSRLARNTGIGSIPPKRGSALLFEALTLPTEQLAIVALAWPQIAGMVVAAGIVPPLLIDLLKEKGGDAIKNMDLDNADLNRYGELRTMLEGSMPAERKNLAYSYVEEQVRTVMGLSEDTLIEPNQPLHELGMDSLMAVEIRNALARGVGKPLPVSTLFDYPSISALAAHLDEQAQTDTISTLKLPGQMNSANAQSDQRQEQPTAPPRAISDSELTQLSPAAMALLSGGSASIHSAVLAEPEAGTDLECTATETASPEITNAGITATEIAATEATATETTAQHPEQTHPTNETNASKDSPVMPTQTATTGKAHSSETESGSDDWIAVIGMACRYPGHANNPEEFWQNLKNGIDTVEDLGEKRFPIDEFYDPDPERVGKTYCRDAGLIDNVENFDNQFFSIAPVEAMSMDPQQRILLETCWEAIESAGYNPTGLDGTRGGVFVGTGTNEYGMQVMSQGDLSLMNAYLGTGNSLSVAAGRISYVLGWQGPCAAVDTACSSSLVGVHLGSQALTKGECDLVLAGGVNLTLSPVANITLSQAQMLSPTGRCRTFDADADGYVRSEGCGVVLLKRYRDAVRDNDNILGIIRGSAINQDGRSQGLTAPNGLAQEAVFRLALERAKVRPEDIDYVEAHGTGTPLGDPIEMRSINSVYGKTFERPNPLWVGSVKSNLGHTEVAAGVAGLIKVLLSMREGSIPPNLHLKTISPYLQLDSNKVRIPTALEPWPVKMGPRIAAVSSFGFSGTNSHAIVQQAPSQGPAHNPVDRGFHLLTLSGRNPSALQAQMRNHLGFLKSSTSSWADLCFTSNQGRAHFTHRLAIVARDSEDAINQLQTLNPEQLPAQPAGKPNVCFLFTGQGSQRIGMGQQLYNTYKPFRDVVDTCDRLLRPIMSHSILDVMWGQHKDLLNQTQYTQPALFVLEYALSTLLRSWGISPQVVAGHSVGEYAAACTAGVFSLSDALKLIAARGQLMQNLPEAGSMMVAMASASDVDPLLAPYASELSVAGYNSPLQTVIAGRKSSLQQLEQTLLAQGIEVRPLSVSHGFHSPMMDPMLPTFRKLVASVKLNKPRFKFYSNVHGHLVSDELTDPEYWVQQVRQPVQYVKTIDAIASAGCNVFVEVGPQPVLLGLARNCKPDLDALWLPCMRAGKDEWQQLLDTIKGLYERGLDLEWREFDAPFQRRRVALPTYPFQRQRFWFESNRSQLNMSLRQQRFPMLGERLRLPGSDEIRFQTHYTTKSPAYIGDHRLFGTVVVPGASHVALFLSAAHAAFNVDDCELTDVCFLQPLVLGENQSRHVHLTIKKLDEKRAAAELMSQHCSEDENSDEPWIVHASTIINIGHDIPVNSPRLNLDDVKEKWQPTFASKDFYEMFNKLGYNLGSAFQWLGDGWYNGATAVRAVNWPKLPDAVKDYQLYPGLVDSLFQSLASCRPAGTENMTVDQIKTDEIYIPFAVESFRFYRRPEAGEPLWYHSTIRPQSGADANTQTGDIQLVDAQGRLVAEVVAIDTRRASRSALQQGMDRDAARSWLYELNWQAKANENALLPVTAGTSENTGDASEEKRWLVIGMPSPLRSQICDYLSSMRQSFECWPHDNDLSHWYTSTNMAEDLKHLFGTDGQLAKGIIHVTASAEPCHHELTALHAHQQAAVSVHLAMLQGLTQLSWKFPPPLWMITENAFQILPQDNPIDLSQPPLWGLARVTLMEHQEFNIRRIDVSSDSEASVYLNREAVLKELLVPGNEDQVAIRNGVRFVARLHESVTDKDKAQPDPYAVDDNTGFIIKVPDDGLLNNLAAAPQPRRMPSAEEVEIAVAATGLNFRDALNALGMFKELAQRTGIAMPDALPLGFDCAGVITRVGSAVNHLQVGQSVFGAAMGALGSHVTTHKQLVVPKPDNLTFAQAAGIPTVFLTVYYGLIHLAKIKAGDRILIHTCAGGVGLAALQVAQAVGAEIYATASPGKWAFLKQLGVQHIMNSRTLEFADSIKTLTNGEGVDIVLNSIVGECIPKSLDLLREGGRFVEIGKLDVWSKERVAERRPDVQYFLFDLTETVRSEGQLVSELLQQIGQDYQHGKLKPLPLQNFPMAQVSDGFRHLAQARNIGKVIISNPLPLAPPVTISKTASYLITGGLGDLGLALASHLVDKGARHLWLTSRKAPNDSVRAKVDKLREKGAEVHLESVDIGDADQVAALLAKINAEKPDLAGIVHAAGVLDDGLLTQMNWSRFQTVMKPKLDGAWHLHHQTLDITLDFFICYSSIASLLGSPGQGNYATANAFLDGLMHARRQQGLPGLSINWGPWADIGMAVGSNVEARLSGGRGINGMLPEKALEAMDKALAINPPQMAIAAIEWDKLVAILGSTPPLLSQLKIRPGASSQENIKAMADEMMAELKEVPPSERKQVLIDSICKHLARVMGYENADSIRPDQPLQELGLDSLMAVEMRNVLTGFVGRPLPATLLFKYPTLEDLAGYMITEIFPDHAQELAAELGEEIPSAEPVAIAAQDEDETVASVDEIAETSVSDTAIDNATDSTTSGDIRSADDAAAQLERELEKLQEDMQ